MTETTKTLLYLVAAAFFIFGLKRLSGVRTARQGNLLASFGMLLAIVVTLVDLGGIDYRFIIAGIIVGGVVGGILAVRVQMTSMPELVAFFNGMGGAASTLVALSIVFEKLNTGGEGTGNRLLAEGVDWAITVVASILIGSVTLSGSVVAYLKLNGKMSGNPILLPARHVLNVAVFLGAIGAAAYLCYGAESLGAQSFSALGVALISLLLGFLLVIPIGGADMPVVISLLNSYSGVAASATGFVLHNNLLIISGALVGASGLILTRIMCKAMNRSLANVLFGGFGAEETGSGGQRSGYTKVKECTAEEAAPILETATSVVFVPGYGLAVAQAQHSIRELAELLEGRGVKVSYAIHPVAGRMPGHMNVLLAEANVPYEQLIEMDDINPEFKNTDVAIIVGANDVVNPVARTDKGSPIYGMPILNVDESRTTFVIKRSLSPGFAGIDNPLFEADNNLMIYGDAKVVLNSLIEELNEN